MGRREETICDLCFAADGSHTVGRTVSVGAWNAKEPRWYSLDLCDAHELELFGQLESLLDIAGSDIPGPKPGS